MECWRVFTLILKLFRVVTQILFEWINCIRKIKWHSEFSYCAENKTTWYKIAWRGWMLTFCFLSRFITQCTEVRFTSFQSGGFITAIIVVNHPERKLTKRTSVQCPKACANPITGFFPISQRYLHYSNHYENPITDPITKMGVARTCLWAIG